MGGAAAGAPDDRRKGDPGAQWDNAFRSIDVHNLPPSSEFLLHCGERMARESLLDRGARVLDLAMGDGRNSIPLALLGYEVTGLDISSVAIEKAQEAAALKGVTIMTVKADIFEYDMGVDRWDMVTNIYFNPAVKIFDRLKKAVRPGGYLLVEGFSEDYSGEGPPVWSRYEANQLLGLLSDWRILEYQDGLFRSEWAGGRTVPVMRVLARKPANPGTGPGKH